MNRVEVESLLRRFGHRDVPSMDRVERAAKKRDGPAVAMSVRFLRRVSSSIFSPGGARSVRCRHRADRDPHPHPFAVRRDVRDISRYTIARVNFGSRNHAASGCVQRIGHRADQILNAFAGRR